MAKNETNLTYLQVPLPSAVKKAKMVKKTWSGYNRRQTVDTGMLSFEENVSTAETPYFTPSKKIAKNSYSGGYYSVSSSNRVSMGIFGFANFFIVVYGDKANKKIMLDYVTHDEGGNNVVHTATIKGDTTTAAIEKEATEEDYSEQICVTSMNIYDVVTDAVDGKYLKKILIYPFKASLNFNIKKSDEDPKTFVENSKLKKGEMHTTYVYGGKYYTIKKESKKYSVVESESLPISYLGDSHPNLKFATVHLSRLFGVDEGRVYASAFNDYANFDIDTTVDINESNAWVSATGANTKAGGEFTGITTFQNHVICFKKDFMHEIYNTKNPFRIQDIYAEGCVDNRTIQDVDGQLIFVSEDNVKVYTGSNPRILSYYLGVDKYNDAVAGTDGRNYYLYCVDEKGEKHIFVYDTYCSQWSRRECPSDNVVGFAYCDMGMYLLCNNGVYKVSDDEYETAWSFETDLITNESCDIKHIEKLQMFCDIDEGSSMKVSLVYDNKRTEEVWEIKKASKNTQKVIRVKPRMTACHGFKVRVEGSGFVRIRTMELLIRGGGDLYV